jgi:hypothetical protein
LKILVHDELALTQLLLACVHKSRYSHIGKKLVHLRARCKGKRKSLDPIILPKDSD